MDKVRNEEVRRGVGAREKISNRDDINVWKGSRHDSGADGQKTVHESYVEGRRTVGWPCTRWLNGVKKACSATSLKL